MKYAALALLAAGLLVSTAQAQTGVFSKCQTLSGNVVVVQGMHCPAGTIWIGNY